MKVLSIGEGFSRGWHGCSGIHLCNRCNEGSGHFVKVLEDSMDFFFLM